MNPGFLLILWHFNDWGGGGVYSPSLDYSDDRNSFYRAMGL